MVCGNFILHESAMGHFYLGVALHITIRHPSNEIIKNKHNVLISICPKNADFFVISIIPFHHWVLVKTTKNTSIRLSEKLSAIRTSRFLTA
jgi:hypothetical protein